jgi:uncharacterized integral membrane protein
MEKLDKPYRGPNGIFPQSYRDSRHAYGNRFSVEKKSAWVEWTFCVVGIICGILSVIFMAGQA